eukprot:1159542-Pelagomonas_calceolata.AAC.9
MGCRYSMRHPGKPSTVFHVLFVSYHSIPGCALARGGFADTAGGLSQKGGCDGGGGQEGPGKSRH